LLTPPPSPRGKEPGAGRRASGPLPDVILGGAPGAGWRATHYTKCSGRALTLADVRVRRVCTAVRELFDDVVDEGAVGMTCAPLLPSTRRD